MTDTTITEDTPTADRAEMLEWQLNEMTAKYEALVLANSRLEASNTYMRTRISMLEARIDTLTESMTVEALRELGLAVTVEFLDED